MEAIKVSKHWGKCYLFTLIGIGGAFSLRNDTLEMGSELISES